MRCLLGILFILIGAVLLSAQSEPRPSRSQEVCVATVSNVSTVSAYLERLTERLVKGIKRSKLKAVAMDSTTTMKPELTPTRQNSDEAEDKQCDYTLLTQIVDTRTHPGIPQSKYPREGAIVPSFDASDPMGGESGPVYREELEIAFALFPARYHDPMVDTYIFEQASANVSDSFLTGMDRIANRVRYEVEKSEP
jgi:hypothetical protein